VVNMSYDLETLASITIEAAKTASQWLREIQGNQYFTEFVKWSEEDVTRRFDVETEKIILEVFRREHVNALFVSEEFGYKRFSEKPEYIVVIDPLDGSNNFTANIPYATVSIAVAKYSKKATLRDIIIGVVSEIFREKIYYAIKGYGAFENGKNLVKPKNIGSPFIFGYLNYESYDVFKELEKVFGAFKLRSLGSASLDIVYVAKSVAGIFLDLRSKLRNVDVAAALLILNEAGGKAKSYHLNLYDVPITNVEKVYSIAAFSKDWGVKYETLIDNIVMKTLVKRGS